jgi:hypothetical protein
MKLSIRLQQCKATQLEQVALVRGTFLYWENLEFVLLLMAYTLKKFMLNSTKKLQNQNQ